MSLLMTISEMVFIVVMDLLHDSYDRYPLHDTDCHQALHLYHGISFQKHQRTINLTARKPERWTSRWLYILIKKREKIGTQQARIQISFSGGVPPKTHSSYYMIL